ncbi:MAG: DNA topoisomerase 1 [Melioribacteraceae bacterium]|nr:MAG: DNA topoisomerase 1 [Melioribacteraceae bacterium]
MIKNLVIVESPAKAKTIEGFLGKDFVVTSSYGHVRDLEKKNNGVEIENGYKPLYTVPADKKAVVNDLKKLAKTAETVWLASDEDREGEAISWHLKEVLKLNTEKTRRIVFHEITRSAITNAIQHPRYIDDNLVESQQARRILDRLVGFEISPVLWRKVKPSLSAGRVQSVAVRLIVEREREIDAFTAESKFKVTGIFDFVDEKGKLYKVKAELGERFDTEKEAAEFLEKVKDAQFAIESVVKKPSKKTPAPPFTTSTLQQEASRKLRYGVSRTMMIAQRLYESGKITYMRTDSVNLSDEALASSKRVISKDYGEKYSKTRKYKTKSANAQEAHEAIRPTYFDKESVDGSPEEKALYNLIWKRAIASQMADAELEKTTAKISISNSGLKFTASGEVIKFDGFLKVYIESSDDDENGKDSEGLLPPVYEGAELKYDNITATERYSRPPARYTEASLVKKLEEMGIGRPSTYAPTISTIQKRGYVDKEERQGKERNYRVITLVGDNLSAVDKTEITGAEKGKLFPTDIAMLVNDFLLKYFPKIMDYKFTAKVEKELDDIARGERNWVTMLDSFYKPFHDTVEDTIENSERVVGERILEEDHNGKRISVRMARFGPVAQITDLNDPEAKPEYAGLRSGQKLETITLEEALDLFKLPRDLGEYEGKKVVVAIGRFGPYIRHDSKFTSLKKEYDPYTVQLDEAIVMIEEKRKKDAEKLIKVFEENPDYQLQNGRWGPFLKVGKQNYKIPRDVDAKELTYEDCVKIVEEFEKGGGKSKSKAPAKKTTAKKATAKKTTTKKAAAKKTTTKKKK